MYQDAIDAMNIAIDSLYSAEYYLRQAYVLSKGLYEAPFDASHSAVKLLERMFLRLQTELEVEEFSEKIKLRKEGTE